MGLTCNVTFLDDLYWNVYVGGRCVNDMEVLPAKLTEIPPFYEHTIWLSAHVMPDHVQYVADVLESRHFAEDLAEHLYMKTGNFSTIGLEIFNVRRPL